MNKSFDEMESVLRSLRPKVPSDRVRRGIAEQLSSGARATVISNVWVLGTAALALAAGVTAAIVFWPGSDEIQVLGHGTQLVDQSPAVNPPPAMDPPPDVDPPTAVDPPPTLLAYRHKLGESVESLDELLDKHASSLLAGGPSSVETGLLFREVYQN